jgi:hypothetical protein
MAGTVTVAERTHTSVKKITWAWTSDASGNADLVTTKAYDGVLQRLITVPAGGGSAPTDNYDIVINDGDGFDVLLGAGANRDTATTEQVASASLGVVAGDTLTLSVSNAGNAKSGTTHLYIR